MTNEQIGKGPRPRGPGMRGQATRNRRELLPGTGRVEMCTEPMGGAPRAGFVLMEGPEQILRLSPHAQQVR